MLSSQNQQLRRGPHFELILREGSEESKEREVLLTAVGQDTKQQLECDLCGVKQTLKEIRSDKVKHEDKGIFVTPSLKVICLTCGKNYEGGLDKYKAVTREIKKMIKA